MFLTLVGPATYKLLRSLIAPANPTDKTLAQLVEVLANHYSPKPSEIMQRYRFYSRTRKTGESVANYVAALRSLGRDCKFGATLETMLRDRLACGINNSSIQKKLLGEHDLTFARALAIAEASEAADRDLHEMKPPRSDIKEEETYVHQMQSKPPTCYRCGTTGHLANECRHKDKVCHNCGMKGHLSKVCKTKPVSQDRRKSLYGKTRTGTKPIRRTEEESSDSECEANIRVVKVPKIRVVKVPKIRVVEVPKIRVVEEPKIHTITVRKVRPYKETVLFDEIPIEMELDSGASVSVMSEELFNKLWPKRQAKACSIKLRSVLNEPLPVIGAVEGKVSYEGHTATLPLVIVGGKCPTLLGRDWLEELRLGWSRIKAVSSNDLQAKLRNYDDVFQPGLGNYKGFQARIDVDPEANPRFYKARTVPYAMRLMVDKELDRLVQEGTLEPVEHSDWAAPIVAVLKPDRKNVRICGDFRLTVNPVAKLDRYPIPRIEDLFATLQNGKYFSKLDLSQAYQQLSLNDQSKKYVVINTVCFDTLDYLTVFHLPQEFSSE